MNGGNGTSAVADAPLPFVRQSVRDLLLASPAYHELPPEQKREMAGVMVRVCDTAARLVAEELASGAAVQSLLDERENGATAEPAAAPPLARAQAAGDAFSGVAARRIAGTTRAILNAVSFPSFVTDLINGVFKAMTESNLAQMQSYVELLNNVAASTSGFADLNYAPQRAREWLVQQFPSAFMLEGEEEELGGDDWGGDDGGWGAEEEPVERRVVLRPDAQRPSDEALRTALGMEPDVSIPSGDPDRTLVPLVRQHLAQTRQQTLATMVQLGMQRIVVDGGRIHASMRFHIDTRSAAQADEGSTFDFRNTINAAGSFGWGPWGVSASMQNTIGYVSTSQTQTTEEMNVDLDLNSAVEIIFRTDQVPLNRLASADQTTRILANSRNPAEEGRISADERRARRETERQASTARGGDLRRVMTPTTPERPAAGSPGTVEHAEAAREAAQRREAGGQQGGGQQAGGTAAGGTAAGGQQGGGQQAGGGQQGGGQQGGGQQGGGQQPGAPRAVARRATAR